MRLLTRAAAATAALALPFVATLPAQAQSHYNTYAHAVCISYKQTSHGVDPLVCLKANVRRQDDGTGFVVSKPRVFAEVNVPDYPERYKCSEGFRAIYNDSTMINRVDSRGGGHPALWHRTTPDLEPTSGCYHKWHAHVNVNGYGASVMFYFEADMKYGHNESGRIGLFIGDHNSACNNTTGTRVVCSSERVS